MNRREKILKYLSERKSASGREISEFLGISRQATNKHIKALIQQGSVVKEGTTKGAVYAIAGKTTAAQRLRRTYVLEGLEEDRVFKEIESLLNLTKNLGKNVFDIVRYAFTEILNNAVEHSRSDNCDIEVRLGQYSCEFGIRDYGVGIFYSICEKFDLPDETAALGELIKGKTTTMEEKHTGEGVFFTSKCGDTISFRSHRINVIFDNPKDDVFVQEKRFARGTEVKFSISRASRRNLRDVFELYAPEEFDYKFEKTRVAVKLFQEEYISRSEARRLLSGLDKFKEIILDFKGVKSIGQGFADEVFRVFRKRHPDILIKTANLAPILTSMIKHVVDNKV